MTEIDFNMFTDAFVDEFERHGFEIADYLYSVHTLSDRLVNSLIVIDGANKVTIDFFDDLEVKLVIRDVYLNHFHHTFNLTDPNSTRAIFAAFGVAI